jgi:hypothetical protein
MGRATWVGAIGTAGLVLALGTGAAAFDDPGGFRGAKWGDSIDQVAARLAEQGSGWSEPCTARTYGVLCAEQRFTVGELRVPFVWEFGKDTKGLERVQAEVLSIFIYPNLFPVLVERYGPPSEEGVTVLKNRLGATLNSRWSMWVGPDTTISLRESFSMGNMASGLLKIEPTKDLAAAAQRSKKAIKEGAEKLR